MAYNIFDPFILLVIYLHFSLDTLKCEKFTKERLREQERYKKDEEFDENEFEDESEEIEVKQEGSRFFSDVRWMMKYNSISIPHMLIYASYVINLIIFFLITALYSAFSHARHPITKEYVNPILRYLESCYIVDMFAKYENTRQFNLAVSLLLFLGILNKLIYCYGHLRRAKLNKHHYKHLSIVQSTMNYMRTLNLNTDGWIDLGKQMVTHDCRNANCMKYKFPGEEEKMMFRLSKIDRLYYYNVIDFTSCFEQWRTHDKKHRATESQSLMNRIITYLHPNNSNYYVPQPKYRIDIRDLSFLVISYISSVTLASLTMIICNYSFWHLVFVEAEVAGIDLKETTSAQVEWLSTNVIMMVSGTECGTILLTGIFCYSRIKMITRLIDKELELQRLYMRDFIYSLEHAETQLLNFVVDDKVEKSSILTDQHFMDIRRKFRNQIDPFIVMQHNDNLDYIVSMVGVLKDELADFKRAYTVVMNFITIFGIGSTTIILTIARKSNTWSEILIALPLILLSATPVVFCSVTSAMVESAFRDLVKKISFIISDGLNLIDTDVNLRMNGIYVHLTQLDNRSFILFANFPLSFSSLMTISAWICNVYQALVEQELV